MTYNDRYAWLDPLKCSHEACLSYGIALKAEPPVWCIKMIRLSDKSQSRPKTTGAIDSQT